MSQLPLQNRRIALAEGRQIEELAAMLGKDGATVLRYPMLSILDAPDTVAVQHWLDAFLAGQFPFVILQTGEGLRRLLAFAERHAQLDAFKDQLAKTRFAVRGPKPMQELRKLDLKPAFIASPATTPGLIEALHGEPLEGVCVGVVMYAPENPPLLDYLQSRGAVVQTVLPYVLAPASEATKVEELIMAMDAAQIDCLVFTSAPQADRLLEIAKATQREEQLQRGFAKTVIAAVGPVIAAALTQAGATVTIMPEQGFVMKNLVQKIVRHFRE